MGLVMQATPFVFSGDLLCQCDAKPISLLYLHFTRCFIRAGSLKSYIVRCRPEERKTRRGERSERRGGVVDRTKCQRSRLNYTELEEIQQNHEEI